MKNIKIRARYGVEVMRYGHDHKSETHLQSCHHAAELKNENIHWNIYIFVFPALIPGVSHILRAIFIPLWSPQTPPYTNSEYFVPQNRLPVVKGATGPRDKDKQQGIQTSPHCVFPFSKDLVLKSGHNTQQWTPSSLKGATTQSP